MSKIKARIGVADRNKNMTLIQGYRRTFEGIKLNIRKGVVNREMCLERFYAGNNYRDMNQDHGVRGVTTQRSAA